MIVAKVEATLKSHTSAVNAVRFTKDGSYCLTCSDDRTVKLWNPFRRSSTENGQENDALLIKTYTGAHGYGVLDLVVSHDNESFASAGHDKTAFLWDVTSAQVVRRLQGHQHRINALALNADSTVLATASYDKNVHLWDLRSKNKTPLQSLTDCKDSATSVHILEHRIVVGCVDGVLRTYDLRMGLLHRDDLSSPIVSLQMDKRGTSALTLCLGKSKGTGSLYKSQLDVPRMQQVWKSSGNSTFKSEAHFWKDGNLVVSGDEEGSLRWWQVDESRGRSSICLCSTPAHDAPVSSLSCHPQLSYLLSAGYETIAKLWSVNI
jgi:mitogen-activated protein kinase organizer 1